MTANESASVSWSSATYVCGTQLYFLVKRARINLLVIDIIWGPLPGFDLSNFICQGHPFPFPFPFLPPPLLSRPFPPPLPPFPLPPSHPLPPCPPLLLSPSPSPTSLPSPSPSLPLPLEVGPVLRLGSLEERLSSPSGSGQSPAAKRILGRFELKSRHLVATVLMTFLRNNLPNFVHFTQ